MKITSRKTLLRARVKARVLKPPRTHRAQHPAHNLLLLKICTSAATALVHQAAAAKPPHPAQL
jgi:hypothetical protein